MNGNKEKFEYIYSNNYWGSRESLSGLGSELHNTEEIRRHIPIILKEFSIKSIFDGPCGDFNWMKHIDLSQTRYIGGDIVEPLVQHLEKCYSNAMRTFITIDLVRDSIPTTDLMLNRDCLFHLSFHDILNILENFYSSETKMLLTTSHDTDSNFLNADIDSGGFRLIDLFKAPFMFPKEYLYKISEPGNGNFPSRSLYLWNRSQVLVGIRNLREFLQAG